MKTITCSGILLIFAVLVSPMLVDSNAAGPPDGLDVKVINDSTEPVPVTGEVNATVSGDVNVVNTPSVVVENDNPILVNDNSRPSLITTSINVLISTGETSGARDFARPTCPEGERFLISGLYASPTEDDFPDTVSLPAWIVHTNVFQLESAGFFSVRLIVASQGHLHASATLPGGQALGGDPMRVNLASPATSDVSFSAHVTGFCGTPFIGP